jgi:hypothetical protein
VGTGEEFDALSDSDKERVATFYEEGRHLSEMRPLTAAQRAGLKRDRAGIKKGGRPKFGKGENPATASSWPTSSLETMY